MDRGDRSLIGVEVELGRTVNMGNFENIKPIVRLPAYILTDTEISECNDYTDIVDMLFGKCEYLIDREIKFQERKVQYTDSNWSVRRLKNERQTIVTEGFSAIQLKVLNEKIDTMMAKAEADVERKRQYKLKELDSFLDSINYSIVNNHLSEDEYITFDLQDFYNPSREEKAALKKLTYGQVKLYQSEELLSLLVPR